MREVEVKLRQGMERNGIEAQWHRGAMASGRNAGTHCAERRAVCTAAPYLPVKGVLQSVSGVVSVKAGEIGDLRFEDAAILRSHAFH
ncbi:MAG: hypothetical protein ACRD4O_18770 [Bryobacteraceae bacterium]